MSTKRKAKRKGPHGGVREGAGAKPRLGVVRDVAIAARVTAADFEAIRQAAGDVPVSVWLGLVGARSARATLKRRAGAAASASKPKGVGRG